MGCNHTRIRGVHRIPMFSSIVPTTGTVRDIDDNLYNWITIGTQQWMIENLRTTTYADGTPISNITESNGFDDWFLPSKDELDAMYTELHAHSVGDFSENAYCSSSQRAGGGGWNIYMWAIRFSDHFITESGKSSGIYLVRAARTFISSSSYSLRDEGEAGGLIFHITDNGDGTYTYYEAAPTDDPSMSGWCANTDSGTEVVGAEGTAIGTGQSNTTAILSTVSIPDQTAAYLCDTFNMTGWINDTEGAYCWYNNDIVNKTDYGALYNGYAVGNASGLADDGQFTENGVPSSGWRVPTQTDWETLITFIGGTENSNKLKEVGNTHWDSPSAGTDDYGFKAVGAGTRNWQTGVFGGINGTEYIWSSTIMGASYYRISIDYATNHIAVGGISKNWGCTVRCVRDVVDPGIGVMEIENTFIIR